MENKFDKKTVIQTLKDAGCDDDTISCLLEKFEKGEERECLCMLEEHRNCLLEQLHKGHKNIDCLDYFVYKIKKDKE